ncbi:MAG: wax ester/triacylglycerol synthase family O-acyltransferase [Myxococcota bacterium]
MASAYERLSTQDSSFVMFEHRATHMHVAAMAVFEAGALATEGGGLDVARIGKLVEARLHLLPRYRQRLRFTPLQGHPIWVDDGRFNLAYHLRHTSLPKPGDAGALKRLAGRILSQHLDREKPLWEIWLVEGLEGDRFAMIAKVHHCMVDGVGGVSLLGLLLGTTPEARLEPPRSWLPRPMPSPLRLTFDEGLQRARLPAAVLRGLRTAVTQPSRALGAILDAGHALGDAMVAGLHSAPTTPLNRPIGPHRQVDWRRLDLGEVKEVKSRLGGTVNDVVLAVVTGALRRFLLDWGVDVDGLDFRVIVPVNMRTGQVDLATANRVSGLFVSLPLDEPDPRGRLARIRGTTERLKRSRAAAGIDLLTRFADLTGSTLLTQAGVQLASMVQPYNMIVTNVPGPQQPLYMLGARMLELYPHLPLFENQGLGVAAMSYHGKIGLGLVGDWDVVPHLPRFAEAIEISFEELQRAAARR